MSRMTDELKESTERVMKKACAYRLGELVGEIYCEMNGIPTLEEPFRHYLKLSGHPYADLLDYQNILGVRLPNMRWSDTTFRQFKPVEFARRMFDVEPGDEVKYYTPGFIMGFRNIVHNVYDTDPDEFAEMILLQLKITRKVELICQGTQN